jgi:mannose-6-phosphate isomerase-like protein (cupin superfamily)
MATPLITNSIAITDHVYDIAPPPVVASTWPNMLHTRIVEVVTKMGPPPWSARLIQDERNSVTLIASGPGDGNRPHWHRDFDEWWFVVAGQLRWEMTGGHVFDAKAGDIIWVPRGTVHHITTLGDEMALRLAVAMPPAVHIAATCEGCGHEDAGPREWGNMGPLVP